ncbi:MAG: HAMP domain-containing protein [Acidobacteria bacterium]|nr:HAMP domain-containing protein [Acidobacteriota bacterium]
MPDPDRRLSGKWGWRRLAHSISGKLILLLVACLTGVFGLLGYLNVRLHRRHLEQNTLISAERVSDVIQRSTSYYMLHNDREGLHQAITTMASEPGVVKLRVFNQDGQISFSSDPGEIGQNVDKNEEACYACHAQAQPLTRLNRPDRFRIYRVNGARVLGVIAPIENRMECSSAPCHAHPVSQQVLGVLDTNLSLAQADVNLVQSSRRMLLYTILAMIVVSLLSAISVWRIVGRPVHALHDGTERLGQGELGYQIAETTHDELGELARSFNQMSTQLQAAHEEAQAWARTLEDRVERKTAELKRAHEHMLQTEKMASVGKMAAVLAHEINNPLSGILTYAKLLSRWLEREDAGSARREDIRQSLELIVQESRRCGDLVKNLLTFSRAVPMNLQSADVNQVVDRALRLVQHQLDIAGVEVHLNLQQPAVTAFCDMAQMEQALIALMLNAKDAMPRGGNLWVSTGLAGAGREVSIQIRDDGSGIGPEILPHIFEPFLTTKEHDHGVGLGLAITRGIIERHKGRIEVQSEVGKGTTFTIVLPCEDETAPSPVGAAAEGKQP